MATPRRRQQHLSGIGLLLGLIALIALIVSQQRTIVPETGQADPVVVDQIAQLPTGDAPLPTVIISGTIWPTATPIPTVTPRPLPTRRPGPTATPYPTPEISKSAAGTIFYVVVKPGDMSSSVRQFHVNAQGEKITEPTHLPETVNFPVAQVVPAPNGKYSILMEPAMPGGIPHVFDVQAQKTWLLLPQFPSLPGIVFAWHPNSEQVVFWSLDTGLWLVNVETSERTEINVIDGPVQGADISPDGQEIMYIAKDNTTYNTMWKVSSTGSDPKLLFHFGGPAYLFQWSSRNNQVLYMGGPGIDAGKAIAQDTLTPMWLTDADGQNSHAVAGSLLIGWGYEPAWSPDGQFIAFVGLDEDTKYGCAEKNSTLNWETCRFTGTAVYLSNPNTEEVRRLAAGINPTWSPDGSHIAFLSNQSSASEVWIIQVESGESRQVTSDGEAKTQIVWSSNWGE